MSYRSRFDRAMGVFFNHSGEPVLGYAFGNHADRRYGERRLRKQMEHSQMARPATTTKLPPDNVDWTQTTRCDRVRFLIPRHYGGDVEKMARIVRLPVPWLRKIASGAAVEVGDDQVRTICLHSKTVSKHWLVDGKGPPFMAQAHVIGAPLPDSHAVPEPPAVVARLRTLLDLVFRGDRAIMAERCDLDRIRLDTILAGGGVPDEDFLLSVASGDSTINLAWLVDGTGEPILRPDAPEPVGPAQQKVEEVMPPDGTRQQAPAANALEGLLGFAAIVTKFQADLDALRPRVEAASGVAEDVQKLAAVVARVSTTLGELQSRFDVAASAAAAEARRVVGPLDSAIVAATKIAQGAVDATGDLSRQLSGLEAAVRGQAAALEAVPRLHEEMREQMVVVRTRLDKLAAARQPMISRTEFDSLVARVAAIASSPAAEDVRMRDWITIHEWCTRPGPHGRVVRDDSDRRTMGRLMGIAYAGSGMPGAGVRPRKYEPPDMDLYARWRSTAGLSPTVGDWVRYWEDHRVEAGKQDAQHHRGAAANGAAAAIRLDIGHIADLPVDELDVSDEDE